VRPRVPAARPPIHGAPEPLSEVEPHSGAARLSGARPSLSFSSAARAR
jgi:hypothetical protein